MKILCITRLTAYTFEWLALLAFAVVLHTSNVSAAAAAVPNWSCQVVDTAVDCTKLIALLTNGDVISANYIRPPSPAPSAAPLLVRSQALCAASRSETNAMSSPRHFYSSFLSESASSTYDEAAVECPFNDA